MSNRPSADSVGNLPRCLSRLNHPLREQKPDLSTLPVCTRLCTCFRSCLYLGLSGLGKFSSCLESSILHEEIVHWKNITDCFQVPHENIGIDCLDLRFCIGGHCFEGGFYIEYTGTAKPSRTSKSRENISRLEKRLKL